MEGFARQNSLSFFFYHEIKKMAELYLQYNIPLEIIHKVGPKSKPDWECEVTDIIDLVIGVASNV